MKRPISAALAGALVAAALAAGGAPPEITVQVLEDAWRVGDEKTYTLLFDRAPLGRQAMRLVALRERDDGTREAVFRQRITLDLRALGQEGSFESAGTIVYLPQRAGPYRYEEAVIEEGGYDTYRDRGDYREAVAVTLDPERRLLRVGKPQEEGEERPLPAAGDAVLVDFLMLAHWERVFAMQPRWALGETRHLPLLIPTPPARLDFHLPVRGPRPVEPALIDAAVTVEAVEEIDLFGARVETFRCRVEPPGMTLWVSPHGGVLRFDDGRGLTGALEP